MKNKKVISVIAAIIMSFAITTNAFGVTQQYHSWVPKIPEITWDSLSDESKDIINQIVNDTLEDNNSDKKTLRTPKISESIYHHSRFFWDSTRLQIRWNEIENADYYEVEIIKTNGNKQTYTSDYNSLIVNKDEFINECIRSSKVRVRACSNNNFDNSNWSESEIVSCNSLHRN